MIQLELYQLNNLCMKFAELGAAQYVKLASEKGITASPKSERISQRRAFNMFGKERVERWRRDGLLSVRYNGSSKNSRMGYSFAELLALDTAESPELSRALSVRTKIHTVSPEAAGGESKPEKKNKK